ncbi:uncharacterized protein LOC134223290 isoform X2 [Armigeres subalbatus]|uniref:uncharacterized protein LOC134223290 isoform X2 n=1 Tax=Armigeres subalbatus TaxID=124917 RepID=UPI002ED687DF
MSHERMSANRLLTIGCLADMIRGHMLEKPLVQILGSKRISNQSERVKLSISDELHQYSLTVLAKNLNELYEAVIKPGASIGKKIGNPQPLMDLGAAGSSSNFALPSSSKSVGNVRHDDLVEDLAELMADDATPNKEIEIDDDSDARGTVGKAGMSFIHCDEHFKLDEEVASKYINALETTQQETSRESVVANTLEYFEKPMTEKVCLTEEITINAALGARPTVKNVDMPLTNECTIGLDSDDEGCLSEFWFKGIYIERLFRKQRSMKKIDLALVRGDTPDEILRCIWKRAEKVVKRQVIFEGETPHWSKKRKPGFEDIAHFISLKETTKKKVYTTSSITPQMLKSWRDKAINIFVHVYSTGVNTSVQYRLILRRPITLRKTSPSGTHYSTVGVLNSESINSSPANAQDQLMQAQSPPRKLSKCFQSAGAFEATQQQVAHRNTITAQTNNDALSRDIADLKNDEGCLSEFWFKGIYIERLFRKQRSMKKIDLALVRGDTPDEILRCIWKRAEKVVKRQVIFEGETPHWSKKRKPGFEDIAHFISLKETTKKKVYTTSSITPQMLKSWRDKAINIFVHVYSTGVNTSVQYRLILRRPITLRKTSPSGTHYSTVGVLNSESINSSPANAQDQLMQAQSPPRKLSKCFQSAGAFEATQQQVAHRNTITAQTNNDALSRDIADLKNDLHKAINILQGMEQKMENFSTYVSYGISNPLHL